MLMAIELRITESFMDQIINPLLKLSELPNFFKLKKILLTLSILFKIPILPFFKNLNI